MSASKQQNTKRSLQSCKHSAKVPLFYCWLAQRLTSLPSTLPCTQGWGWLVPPIHHRPHHPSPRASWHLGPQLWQGCHPSPQASCPQDRESSLSHPSPRASWPWDPTEHPSISTPKMNPAMPLDMPDNKAEVAIAQWLVGDGFIKDSADGNHSPKQNGFPLLCLMYQRRRRTHFIMLKPYLDGLGCKHVEVIKQSSRL